jgi:hypothetical protein
MEIPAFADMVGNAMGRVDFDSAAGGVTCFHGQKSVDLSGSRHLCQSALGAGAELSCLGEAQALVH